MPNSPFGGGGGGIPSYGGTGPNFNPPFFGGNSGFGFGGGGGGGGLPPFGGGGLPPFGGGGFAPFGGGGFAGPVGGYSSGGRFPPGPTNFGNQFAQGPSQFPPFFGDFSNSRPSIGGYGSQLGFGGTLGINIPPPFGTYTGPNVLANYRPPVRPRPPPPPVIVQPFSNYDSAPQNGGFPVIPRPFGPSSYVNYPMETQPRPYNYIPFAANREPEISQFAASDVSAVGPPVIKREKLCVPTRDPLLTGICRNSFDVINRKVCVNMEIDGRSQECLPSQLCCYWGPTKQRLENRISALPLQPLSSSVSRVREDKVQPGYLFVTRESGSDNADYFRVGSRVIRPVDDDSGSVRLVKTVVDTHDEEYTKGRRSRPGVPEAVAAERRAELRLVPRTIAADELPLIGRQCGKMGSGRSITRTGKILRGDSVEAGELCWQAAIFSGKEFLCGGALVTAFHVLTSAHCVQRCVMEADNLRRKFRKNVFKK
jgi:hypothetical protein